MTIEPRCLFLGNQPMINCCNEKDTVRKSKAASNPDKKIIISDDCLQDSSRVENEIAPLSFPCITRATGVRAIMSSYPHQPD
jgi:hypothetical protein